MNNFDRFDTLPIGKYRIYVQPEYRLGFSMAMLGVDIQIERMMRTSKEWVKANKQFKGD